MEIIFTSFYDDTSFCNDKCIVLFIELNNDAIMHDLVVTVMNS